MLVAWLGWGETVERRALRRPKGLIELLLRLVGVDDDRASGSGAGALVDAFREGKGGRRSGRVDGATESRLPAAVTMVTSRGRGVWSQGDERRAPLEAWPGLRCQDVRAWRLSSGLDATVSNMEGTTHCDD
jgi:hypothetical protein